MTRPLPRRLLTLALVSALSAPALAQTASPFAAPVAPPADPTITEEDPLAGEGEE